MELTPPAPILQIDDLSRSYLAETVKWARFLAIVGFVVCGLVVLLGIFAGAFFSTLGSLSGQNDSSFYNMMPGFFSVLYILMALLYFFPCLYLFRFANKTKMALQINDQEELTNGLANLKSLFKFVGLLTAIMLGIYALVFLLGIVIMGAMRA